MQAHVCVTSYDLVQKLEPDMIKKYGFVLVDESHCLKSRDTKRTQVWMGLGTEGLTHGSVGKMWQTLHFQPPLWPLLPFSPLCPLP